MFRLCSRITITNQANEVFTLDSVKHVQASAAWDNLVDTASVEFPKNLYVTKNNTKTLVSFAERTIAAADPTGRSEKAATSLFAVGDKIRIELGYDFSYNVLLEGMITGISATVPIVLQCADPMWILGRIKLAKDITGVQSSPPMLSALLADLQKQYLDSAEVTSMSAGWEGLTDITFEKDANTLDFPLVNYSVLNKTILAVLEELKNTYHLYSYFELKKNNAGEITSRIIRCGNYYTDGLNPDAAKIDKDSIKKFHFQNNVISEELVNKNENDIKLAIKATNIESKSDSTANVSTSVGSTDADAKTVYMDFHKLTGAVQDILENIALRKLKTIRYTGYSGSFVSFGKPFVKHGDTVQLIDDYLNERNGLFKVRQVDYSFGDNGFKQKIYPHLKID